MTQMKSDLDRAMPKIGRNLMKLWEKMRFWDPYYAGGAGAGAALATGGDLPSAAIVGGMTLAFRMAARLGGSDLKSEHEVEQAGKTGALVGATAAAAFHFWFNHSGS